MKGENKNKKRKNNHLLEMIIKNLPEHGMFVDLGCGFGRDSFFMLRNGFIVDSVDLSEEALQKMSIFLDEKGFDKKRITIHHDDISRFSMKKNYYDVVSAMNSIQFLSKEKGLLLIERMKDAVKGGGYVAIMSFLPEDPYCKKEVNSDKCCFDTNELLLLFSDFEIIHYEEKAKHEEGHYGQPLPHTHHLVELVAKKSE